MASNKTITLKHFGIKNINRIDEEDHHRYLFTHKEITYRFERNRCLSTWDIDILDMEKKSYMRTVARTTSLPKLMEEFNKYLGYSPEQQKKTDI